MMIVIGKKVSQTQKFLSDGTRIPVTVVSTPGNTVMMHKTQDKEGYWAVQLGLGERKIANKPQMGHATKAHLQKAPQFLFEARLTDKESTTLPAVGDMIATSTLLQPGDMVDVRGKSKGKGFASGIKRYQFKGGPKTHGQSDRHRAPGSIGSGTTPGRVYRGKRMAGKMGNDMTTLKNLEVVAVGEDFIWLKGVVPGKIGAAIVIEPTGKKNKKFLEVLKDEGEKKNEEGLEEVVEVKSEVKEEVSTEETKVEVQPELKEELPVISNPAERDEKSQEKDLSAEPRDDNTEEKTEVGVEVSSEPSSPETKEPEETKEEAK